MGNVSSKFRTHQINHDAQWKMSGVQTACHWAGNARKEIYLNNV